MALNTVLKFWYEELSPQDWWRKDDSLDQQITERFLSLHQQAVAGELYPWRESAEGRLAEIIIIDQFSRNMFRDTARAFQYDPIALVLSQEAVNVGADKALQPTQKSFLYMPHMHSESKIVHEQAVKLFSQPELEHNLEFELQHKAIIDRFGRYPHRNNILDRKSSEQEVQFLTGPNSSF